MLKIREKDDHPESFRQCSADSAKNVDSDLKMGNCWIARTYLPL